jgi:hypothetical protein
MALVVQLRMCSPTTILSNRFDQKNLQRHPATTNYHSPSDNPSWYFHIPATWRIGEGDGCQERNHQTNVSPHSQHHWLQDSFSNRYYVSNTIARNGSSAKPAPHSSIHLFVRVGSTDLRTHQGIWPFEHPIQIPIYQNNWENYMCVNRKFKIHVMGLLSRLSGECVCPPWLTLHSKGEAGYFDPLNTPGF